MSKIWNNKDALVTEFDEYAIELKSVIDERAKYTKRAEGKPMAAIEDPGNPHTTNRGEHMRQAASEAVKIAKGLGLNEVVVYIGMLMHDAGQPFGAHEGERVMNIIKELTNIGFYHHNAEGVDTVLSEDIIQKFVDAIPEAENNQELQDKLRDEAWYFLELIVGHDGESTSKENEKYLKSEKKYNSIKEAVLEKVSTARRTNKYKCSVETLEAQLSKPADILAYLKSDILTGFSKGILTDLSDDYLELVGELLAESYEETLKIENIIKESNPEDRNKLRNSIREKRIRKAKEIINSIKKDKLRETRESMNSDSGQEIFEELAIITKKLKMFNIDITDIKDNQRNLADKVIDIVKSDYKERKLAEGEDKNIVVSQLNKLDEYVTKMGQTRKRVIEELMTKMQDALRNDYIETTLANWKEIEDDKELNDEKRYKLKKQSMRFSGKANKIIYGKNGIKDLNYREYVQYAKKVYQTGCLPKGVLRLVKRCSFALMKTGVVINKFYDPEVLRHIDNPQLVKLMHQRDIDEKSDKKYKKQIGIIKNKANNAKRAKYIVNKRFTGKKTKQKMERNSLYRKIYRYTQAQDERFARACEDIYYAIPYTVKGNIQKALDSKYQENEYLPIEEKRKISKTKKELAKRFGKNRKEAISVEDLEEYIEEQIKKERERIELKAATQMCVNYIAGKTDAGIKDLLIRTGMISKKTLEKEDVPNKTGNKVVLQLSAKLREEDEKEK